MCDCSKTEKWCKGTRSDLPYKNMEQIKVGDWCYLVHCKDCGQLWQGEAWGKYAHGLAIKYFGTVEDWNKALNDMAICVEHAYKEMRMRW